MPIVTVVLIGRETIRAEPSNLRGKHNMFTICLLIIKWLFGDYSEDISVIGCFRAFKIGMHRLNPVM